MISHNEAQELHRLIGGAITDLSCMAGATTAAVRVELDGPLTRALELAAVLVSDTMGDRTPDPSPVSYAPCITGKIESDADNE